MVHTLCVRVSVTWFGQVKLQIMCVSARQSALSLSVELFYSILSVSLSLAASLPRCLPASLPRCLAAPLPRCLPARPRARPPACLPACLPSCPPACLPAPEPDHLHVAAALHLVAGRQAALAEDLLTERAPPPRIILAESHEVAIVDRRRGNRQSTCQQRGRCAVAKALTFHALATPPRYVCAGSSR